MQVSMQINLSDDFRDSVERVIAYERRGLDLVWLPEAYGFDSATFAGYLAAKTKSVKIGFGILPIYSRTPSLIAQTAAGLDQVTDGRAVLGLGASGPQVIEGWHGVAYDKPVGRTKEIIEICRRIWSREILVNNGIYQIPLPSDKGMGLGKPLKILSKPLRERIPIYVAALGEKNVAMAFELADGWLPIFYVPEKSDLVWGSAIKSGLKNRDVSLGRPEVVGGGLLAIGDNLEYLRDNARDTLAWYIGGMGARGKNFYFDLAVRYGYEVEAHEIQEQFLGGNKKNALAAVPEELLRDTTLIGSYSFVADRVAAYRDSGVTVFNVEPIGPKPYDSFEKFVNLVKG